MIKGEFKMEKNKKTTEIEVKGLSISVFKKNKDDYISLTDIAKSKDGDSRAADIIKNWNKKLMVC